MIVELMAAVYDLDQINGKLRAIRKESLLFMIH